MLRLIAIVILTAISAADVPAQNMRRSTPPKARRAVVNTPAERIIVEYDTIATPPADSIAVDGFEKPLRSMRESMTIHNNTSRTVEAVELDMVYTDTGGRMIHRARHTVSAAVPAGESRRIDVPTFDSSATFYYRHSKRPRYTSHATPFDVDVTVIYITHPITPEL